MVNHDGFLTVPEDVKCSLSRGTLQVHQQTQLDQNPHRMSVHVSSHNLQGYVFVPTDPFRAAEK